MVIDKPAGLTSHNCVSRLRRCFGLKRVGHGDTLDPAVTGVLPIALGPATRLLPYSRREDLSGQHQLGLTTNTDDLEGEHSATLAAAQQPELESSGLLCGAIQQPPPQVSAVHVDGVRARARARSNKWSCLPAPSPCSWNCSAGMQIRDALP